MDNIKIAYSISLYNVLNKILFIEFDEKNAKERELPFNVKYKLQKDLDMVSKDYIYFENERNNLIKQYGEEAEGKVKVTDENMSTYKEEVMKILNMEVTHKFALLTEEEINSIKDVNIECHEMELFIMYLTQIEE